MTLKYKWVNQAWIVCLGFSLFVPEEGLCVAGPGGNPDVSFACSWWQTLWGCLLRKCRREKSLGEISKMLWKIGCSPKLFSKVILTHTCSHSHTHRHTRTQAWNLCLNLVLLRQVAVSQPMFRPSWNHSFDRKKNHPKDLMSWGSWLHLFHNFT